MMSVFDLKKVLKALLFSTTDPLSIKAVQAVIMQFHQTAAPQQEKTEPPLQELPSLLTATQIREAMEDLAQSFEEQGEVYRLIQDPAGFRLTIAPDYAQWVRLLRGQPKPIKLSTAAMETITIIAYRQPITRAEIEAIRGVAIDGPMAKLLALELITTIGRAPLPGKPLQYGTTNKFLEFVGICSIEELPASDVLNPEQLNAWVKRMTNQQSTSPEDADKAPNEA